MPVFHRERTGDTVDVPDELTEKYDADPDWAPVKRTTATPAPKTTTKSASTKPAADTKENS